MDSHCNYHTLFDSVATALKNGIDNGRNGKGTIFTFASGNEFDKFEDVNFMGYTNSRFTISVGAVSKSGLHTDYSTAGTALFVSAPVGGKLDTGKLLSAGLDDSCTDSGTGTSNATPVVSGVIALMLEVNSSLTWRDVQGIIAQTSTYVNDDEDDTDTENDAGFKHSDWYGFGIINAKGAVDAAKNWALWTEELEVTKTKNEDDAVLLDEDGNEFESVIQIDGDDADPGFIIESTVIRLELSHYNRGDLKITLTSPSGTVSILHPGKRPEDTREDSQWELMTVKNWGENPHGDWTLTIRDLVDREDDNDNKPLDNIFKQWELVIFGRAAISEVPSSSPTKSASPSMSSSPSSLPSILPSTLPSNFPSTSPSSNPSTSSSPTETPNLRGKKNDKNNSGEEKAKTNKAMKGRKNGKDQADSTISA